MKKNLASRRFTTMPEAVRQSIVTAPDQIFLRLAVACLLLISVSSLASAQAGRLDSSFGHGGIFTVNPGTNTGATSVALQSTGKIIIGGQVTGRGALLRINSNGTLDTTFGSGGLVTSSFGIDTGDLVLALAVQPDDKILAVATGFPSGLVVGRFNSNGSVDTSFGNQGFTSRVSNCQPGFTGTMALQPDGQTLAACGSQMARFTTTGQFDTTFGSAGIAPLKNPSSNVNAIAVQANGQILVASMDFGTDGIVTRYNSNGSVDNSFGIFGQAAAVLPTAAMSLQGDGRIIVAGSLTSTLTPPGTGFGLVRFNTAGGVDTTYGMHGGVVTSFPGKANASAFASAIQANGDLVAGGQAYNQLSQSEFALARYTSGGLLDLGFGPGGRVLTNIGGSPAFITAIVLQQDGKIVVAGTGGSNFAVARYLAQ